MRYVLAQLNIAEMRFPFDDPRMIDFNNALDDLNEAAEKSPGFVWRLKDDSNNATSFRVFARDDLLVNLSAWDSVETLLAYVSCEAHLRIMRRRAEWFYASKKPNLVMWWQAGNEMPTVELAEQKLIRLRQDGASQDAFSFKSPFPRPDANDHSIV